MKIDNLKGKVLKCVSHCTGFEIDEPEAVPIFKDRFIEIIDVTNTHVIASQPLYSKFKINRKRICECFVISDTGEKINS